ncbi:MULTISPECIES: hypothetical protein [Comamonas]|uniref:hypothetical protein n=1 Tax=Comamonas TaxID=283 RepID=UPI0025810125|nr:MULTISPECIES: hypothetical protein [Comamonas]
MSCSLFKPTTPLRTKIGVVVTAVYLLLLGLLLYAKWPQLITLELNELGDFAAGAFGPLAFLWLILGYMQQGDELKQNTDALRLQAEELAKNVMQQEALVALGQQQLEREKQQVQDERDRQAAAARPKFELSVVRDAYEIDGWTRLEIRVQNVGAICSHMRVNSDTRGLHVTLEPHASINHTWWVIAQGSATEPFEVFDFSISYLDIAGSAGSQKVFANLDGDEESRWFNVYGEDDMRLWEARRSIKNPRDGSKAIDSLIPS